MWPDVRGTKEDQRSLFVSILDCMTKDFAIDPNELDGELIVNHADIGVVIYRVIEVRGESVLDNWHRCSVGFGNRSPQMAGSPAGEQ